MFGSNRPNLVDDGPILANVGKWVMLWPRASNLGQLWTLGAKHTDPKWPMFARHGTTSTKLGRNQPNKTQTDQMSTKFGRVGPSVLVELWSMLAFCGRTRPILADLGQLPAKFGHGCSHE